MRNPLKEIKEKNNWTLQDFATATDTSSSTIYKNLEGSVFEITDRILNTLEGMGYDPKEVRKNYQEFRKSKRSELITK